MTGLAARLYAALAADPGNLAVSPHSVAVALNLAAYGARGRTRDEIETVVDGAGWRSARLPYVGGTLAMTVVLPDAGRLAEVEAQVAASDWSAVLDVSAPERLELRLPRFTVRAGARLREILAALGMPTAFTDELGTEAAAATAVVMQRAGAMPAPPVPFVVDRPFLFAIHDVSDGTLLFVGRVVDPRA